MSTSLIRPATPTDVEAIKTIAVDAEMFDIEEVEFFDEMLDGYFDGSLQDHHWLVVEHDGVVIAGANFAPEPFADRMWNLYFIAVTPERQSQGVGATLIAHIESELTQRGSDVARILVGRDVLDRPVRTNTRLLPSTGLRRRSSYPPVLRPRRRQGRLLEVTVG